MAIPWILIAVGVLLILLLIALIFIRRKKKTPPDYYVLFIIGITWFAIGIPLRNYALWAVGLILTVVGLAHKKDWKKNHKAWKQLSKNEQKVRIIIMIALGVLVLLGLAAFLLVQKGMI